MGLPPLAGIWDEVVYTTATRAAFRKDPMRWYNEFWIPHFFMPGSRKKPVPNSGHLALDALIKEHRNVRQVTQNIDGLQPPGDQIVEAHGRLGLYKCLPDDDSDSESDEEDSESDNRPIQLGNRRKSAYQQARNICPFQYLESLEEKDVEPARVRSAIQNCRTGTLKEPSLPSPPQCSFCKNIVLPQALLFDEGYHSHNFYQFAKIEDWLSSAEVLVFVGTSFAVSLTQTALDVARARHLPIYNFNVSDLLVASHRLDATNIIGPAAVSLPQLLATCRSLTDMPAVAVGRCGELEASHKTVRRSQANNLVKKRPGNFRKRAGDGKDEGKDLRRSPRRIDLQTSTGV
eukprot:scaffold5305_cov164-Amphora_coffeaeformis.AAC.3